MQIVGWVFIAIVGLIALVGLVMGLVSLPDAKRYLKIRRM
ncbi:DUF6893 family small protein [Mycobacterium intracellulare]